MNKHRLAFVFILAVIAVFVLVLLVAELSRAGDVEITIPVVFAGSAIPAIP